MVTEVPHTRSSARGHSGTEECQTVHDVIHGGSPIPPTLPCEMYDPLPLHQHHKLLCHVPQDHQSTLLVDATEPYTDQTQSQSTGPNSQINTEPTPKSTDQSQVHRVLPKSNPFPFPLHPTPKSAYPMCPSSPPTRPEGYPWSQVLQLHIVLIGKANHLPANTLLQRLCYTQTAVLHKSTALMGDRLVWPALLARADTNKRTAGGNLEGGGTGVAHTEDATSHPPTDSKSLPHIIPPSHPAPPSRPTPPFPTHPSTPRPPAASRLPSAGPPS